MDLSVIEVIERLGGVADRTTLLRHVSRPDLERAEAAGDVVRLGRSQFGHPRLHEAQRAAVELGGIVAAVDAARWHGWEVARLDRRPHVVVPRGVRVPARVAAQVHRLRLLPHEHEGLITTPETTLRHCLRWLPFGEALAVADSALRHGAPTSMLERVGVLAQGPGAPRMRRVAREATPLAANPFESMLRAICLDVDGLEVRPQVWVGDAARADLVDERLRIVIEADSFTWHGGRAALARDARRYNRMVVDGWLVLRFTYEDVMHRPEEVRSVLLRAVDAARVHTEVRLRRLPRG